MLVLLTVFCVSWSIHVDFIMLSKKCVRDLCVLVTWNVPLWPLVCVDSEASNMCLSGQIEQWVWVSILLMPSTYLNIASIRSFLLLLYDNVGSFSFLGRSSYVRFRILGKHFVALCCTLSSFSMCFLRCGDHMTLLYSSSGLT